MLWNCDLFFFFNFVKTIVMHQTVSIEDLPYCFRNFYIQTLKRRRRKNGISLWTASINNQNNKYCKEICMRICMNVNVPLPTQHTCVFPVIMATLERSWRFRPINTNYWQARKAALCVFIVYIYTRAYNPACCTWLYIFAYSYLNTQWIGRGYCTT